MHTICEAKMRTSIAFTENEMKVSEAGRCKEASFRHAKIASF